MERSRKLLVIGSLFLVALALLYNNKHGKGNQESPFHSGYSKSLIRISQRSTANPSEDQVVDQVIPYNQFYLVVQWQGTVCRFSNTTCRTRPSKFTIRGLWPQNTAAWPPTNCCGWNSSRPKPAVCSYSSSTISSTLRPQLEVTWPDLFGDNDKFWKDEWEKHGACSEAQINQCMYFEKATNLYSTTGYDFFQILDRAGYRANNNIYNVADMKRAIMTSTGLNVIMKCLLNSNVSYLQEIYVCVNQAATAFQSCASSTQDNCKPQAVFPSDENHIIPYNEFYLVEQWPGTVCRFSNRNCTTRPRKFTIHGLWPQNTAAWPPTNCCGWNSSRPKPAVCSYSSSTISSTLRPQLEVTWPDLFGDNDKFWEHEWEKHGACSEAQINQCMYFEKATNLYSTTGLDFIRALEHKGIKPNGSSYSLSSIKEAIRSTTSLNVIVKCLLNSNKSYLQELYVCVNQDATDFKNCTAGDKCRSTVYFPAP